MFGFVKNWFRTSADIKPADQTAPEPQYPDHPAESGLDSGNPVELAAAAVSNIPTGNNTGPTSEEIVALPFASVFSVLPADLQMRVRLPLSGETHIAVPQAMILPQLERGSVKISFGELRQMSPEAIFYSQTDRDQAVVELPLAEILARLNPQFLPRRAKQRVEVPEEITSPFNGNGEGLHIYKPDPTPPQAFVRKVEKTDDPWTVSMFQPRGMSPSSAPSLFPSSSTPIKAAQPGTRPVIAHKQAPPQTSVLLQAAAQPVDRNGDTLSVPLTQLAEGWPDAIKREITQMNLLGASVSLPLGLTEDSLKKGKAVYAWKQIRCWTNLPLAATESSPHDAELLELPLKVIAPMLMARLRPGQPAKKIQVETDIPDLFSATAPTNPAINPVEPVVVPEVPTVTPPVIPPAVPASVPSSDSTDTSHFLPTMNFAEARGKARMMETSRPLRSGTEFMRRYATPNQIVAKASGMEGVEGALITLPDGLLVASHLPGNLNGDTLAAFVPHLFGRVCQSAREFRMGELTDIRFIVGNTPWHIFKIGATFLAVFGRPGEALPEEQLKPLAAELDRNKQQ